MSDHPRRKVPARARTKPGPGDGELECGCGVTRVWPQMTQKQAAERLFISGVESYQMSSGGPELWGTRDRFSEPHSAGYVLEKHRPVSFSFFRTFRIMAGGVVLGVFSPNSIKESLKLTRGQEEKGKGNFSPYTS